MNPFRYGEVVTGEDFCERPQLVRSLRESLASGRNTVVIGERRTGKTSLIHETARRIRGLRLAHAQLWAVKSVDDVAQRLVDGVVSMERTQRSGLDRVVRALAALRPRIEVDPFTGFPSVTVGTSERVTPHGLQAVLDLVGELARRGRVAVLLDEFQDVARIDGADALLGAIRDRIQRQREVAWVFAGSVRHEMEALFRPPGSPFFKALAVLEVEAIERRRFQAFLGRRFASGDRRVGPGVYERIFALAEDNPSDVQQLCAAIWDRSEPGSTVDEAGLLRALEHLFATERKGYEALVRPLTDIQMRCLRTLAKLGGEQPQSKRFLAESGIRLPGTVKRALDRLVDLELVYPRERRYRFFDPFFRQWLLARYVSG